MEAPNHGTLIISLDLELFWGVNDSKKFSDYKENIISVPEVISNMLNIFRAYDIKVSFATVGSILFNNEKELLAYYQENRTVDLNLPNYNYLIQNFEFIGRNKKCFFLDASIIKDILSAGHEICSHTFSHLYHLQEDNVESLLLEDHRLMQTRINTTTGENLKSIVFPRNQFNDKILSIYNRLGYKAFRGNEKAFFYRSADSIEKNKIHMRVMRYLDSAINISGHNTYKPNWQEHSLKNIKSSYFLRPYSNIKILNSLRLKRIKDSMTQAAISGNYFHIWWHPHNFGKNMQSNLNNLELILDHYQYLNSRYKMLNSTLGNV